MTTNKATLKAEIAHAEKMLKENPTAWHGVRAGWKAQAIVEIPCKPWYDFSELVGAIRKCETRKQFDRMESLCDKAYHGGAITAKQLAKLDCLQADCMIERGVI
jgi:hypothetical protein